MLNARKNSITILINNLIPVFLKLPMAAVPKASSWLDSMTLRQRKSARLPVLPPIHALSLKTSAARERSRFAAALSQGRSSFRTTCVIANTLCPATQTVEGKDDPVVLLQLSAVLTPQVLVTHHYQLLSAVTDAKQFLHRHAGEAGRGPDYLFHLVLDRLVDDYSPEVDRIQERLDQIELQVFASPAQELILELIHTKRRGSRYERR